MRKIRKLIVIKPFNCDKGCELRVDEGVMTNRLELQAVFHQDYIARFVNTAATRRKLRAMVEAMEAAAKKGRKA